MPSLKKECADLRKLIHELKGILDDKENDLAKMLSQHKVNDTILINKKMYAVVSVSRWPLNDYRIMIKELNNGKLVGLPIILDELN